MRTFIFLFSAASLLAAGDAAKTRELLALLKPGTALAEQARACQQLAIVGSPEAVPALAALLGDAQLGHYAREALEAMAAPAADAALREALGRLRGPALIGVINSLGARADAAAIAGLSTLATGSDAAVAGAAMRTLARIGTPEAVAIVRGGLGKSPAAAEAMLVAADRLLVRGRSEEAVKLFDEVRKSHVGGQAALTATRGAILARGAAGVPLLVETLRSKDTALRHVALQAMRELAGAGVTAALVAELDRIDPALQPLVLAALVDRGGEGVLAAVERRAKAGDDEALKALGRIGGPSSVPLLLEVLGKSETAARSLALIPAPEADGLILRALATADPASRIKLITVLGDRGVAGATPELLRLARERDPAVSRAALRALAATAQPDNLPELIRLSATAADDADRTLADRAIYAASMKILEPEERVEPLLAALRTAVVPPERAALFRPLGAVVRALRGSETALAAVKQETRAPDPAVRAAAVKCLADWPDASPAAELLALAKQEAEPIRSTAFAGAVRLATEVAAGRDRTALDSLTLLTQANALVATEPERMMMVSALGNVRRIEALRLLEAHRAIESVKTEAALAIVQIAPPLLGGVHAAEARRTLEKIAGTESDADVRARAGALLKGGAATKKAPGKKKK
ncbi:MAG: HEAT repeat domain-containing protein [Opitutaceae bacterium]|nr:HEAT repeat domain-containing protein [Opitutaceae bacterium]